MGKRETLYFEPETAVETFPSGCTLLDCILGGGWAKGRIANIVGDSSTGKTLLAIEACANFAQKYSDDPIWYLEAEAAFDIPYAETLGLPTDRITFLNDCFTIEDMFEALEEICSEEHKGGLFILDSLDALSDRAEQGRKIDEGTFGASKAKKISELFRRQVKPLRESGITFMVISQVRDNIGATFGKKHTRAGGRALKFYASQEIWLSNLGRLKRTQKGNERVFGVKVRAKSEKSKIGAPFRDCDFPLVFSLGIEDAVACAEWLASTKDPKAIELLKKYKLDKKTKTDGLVTVMDRMKDEEYWDLSEQLAQMSKRLWYEIEESFKPSRGKYNR